MKRKTRIHGMLITLGLVGSWVWGDEIGEIKGRPIDAPEVVEEFPGSWVHGVADSCDHLQLDSNEKCQQMLQIVSKYKSMIRLAGRMCIDNHPRGSGGMPHDCVHMVGIYFSIIHTRTDPPVEHRVRGIGIKLHSESQLISAMPGHLDGVPVTLITIKKL